MIASLFIPIFAGAETPVVDDSLAPVTLAEAKAHLEVDSDFHDVLITGLIRAAAMSIEQITGLVCRARVVTASYPVFGARVILYRRPVNAVVAIEYDAADGTVMTLAPEAWRLREYIGQPALVPAFGTAFPGTDSVDGAVRVTWNAGFLSNADIDEDIRLAALQMIGHWFANREAVATAPGAALVPMAAKALLAPHRRGMLA